MVLYAARSMLLSYTESRWIRKLSYEMNSIWNIGRLISMIQSANIFIAYV